MSEIHTEKPGKGWVTKAQLAEMLDITPRCFDRDYRRYVDPEHERKIGPRQTIWIKARAFLDRWKLAGGRGPGAPVNAEGEIDPLLSGADSPWLENYRKQRALQEEIKLEQMRGNFVALAEIEPALLNLCGMLRRAGETLVRLYGNDAAKVLNEAVEEFEKGIEAALKLETKGTEAEAR